MREMIHTTQNRVTWSSLLAVGVLLALMAASLLLAAQPAHASTTFTVDSTYDYGDQTPGDGKCDTGTIMLIGEACTLRAAIQEANATTGADTINFNIPTTGVATISPAPNELPAITGPLNINGYSQPGAHPNTRAVGSDAVLKIELSGAKIFGSGLRISAANSTVKGLVINQWSTAGIRTEGSAATGNKITGNYIGTDVSGAQDLGNGYYGVSVNGANNTIGGTTVAERNVISGSDSLGVLFEDSGAGGNKVMGNYIGTDATGTKDLGNASHGVSIDDVPNNTIGGTTTGARNVISGNDGQGVAILGNDGNKITGNYVGTDATGTKDLGNTYHGVYIDYGKDNTIGGTTAGERNVISANNGNGVLIEGAGATGNKVTGNYVGTDKNGVAPLGNSANGVYITAPNNTIGGVTAAGRNTISANAGSGVSIYGAGATGNRILQNSIFSNGGLGIDLGDDGPTTNDTGDVDTGPNNLQNKPVLSSARSSATSTTVRGTLNSTPNKTFVVRFFSNPSGDEGRTFIGQKSVTTDASGNATFTFSPTQRVGLGRTVTATTTSPVGNTSEFSAPRSVVAS
jgi:CSLREA domain-containing protein